MSLCPFCKAPLGDADTGAGKCSHCGSPLDATDWNLRATMGDDPPEPPPPDEGNKTVSGQRIDQTLEVDGPPAAPAESPRVGKSTARDVAHTLESASLADGQVPTKPGTVANDPAYQTVNANSLPELESHISQTWGGSEEVAPNPRLTMKGKTREDLSESTLVVQRRALSKKNEPSVGNADYELLDRLGEGGMGFVYLARQASINRVVALKMLKSDTSGDAQQRFKFLSEAVVTGDLDHPNIVPIYDLGVNDEGALFYSMKRVQGTPWLDVIGRKSLQENLEILMKVADAVAFAHARGVVHRDLKPENVMLGEFGEVLLLDWGLALPTSSFEKSESITQTSAMGGTPAYMAPEMAIGPIQRVGPQADIYLLGAILYEIVTGDPPHLGEDVMACLTAAAKNEIQPTSKKGELVDIALRAMATAPEDRFPAVQEFQNAIRIYLAHSESIALTARADEELQRAESSDNYQDYARALFAFQEAHALWDGNDRARLGEANASFVYARSALRKGDFDLGASLLDPQDSDHADLLAEIRAAQRERDLRQQRLRRLRRITRVGVILFLIVVTGASLWIWRERNNALAAERVANVQREIAVDEKQKADAAKEQEAEARVTAELEREKADDARDDAQKAEQVAVQQRQVAVQQRQEADRQRDKAEYQAYIALIGLAAAKIEENAFGTARQLLDQCPAALRHWEWHRLHHLCQLNVQDYPAGSPVESLATWEGGLLLTGGWNGVARIWKTKNGEMLRTLQHPELSFVHAVALSPDGKRAATGTNDPKSLLSLWDVETGERIRTFEGHEEAVVSLAFSGDGQRLLSGSFDRTARLWNVETGMPLRTFRGHRSWVWSASFCYRRDAAGKPLPEQRLVTASQDGFAIIWRLDVDEDDPSQQSPPFRGHLGPVYTAAFAPDGETVATGGNDKRILLWRPADLREFDYDGVIHNESLRSGESPRAIPTPDFQTLAGHTAAVRCVDFDRDGRRLVSCGHDNTVRVWDFQSGKPLKTLRGHDQWVRACAFSSDDQVLSGSYDQQAKRWDVEIYEEVRRVSQGRVLEGHAGDILAASFSSDDQFIVTAGRDRTARMWDVATATEQQLFQEGHAFLASTAAFFPSGQQLITAAVDNSARIWDVTSGTELTRLDGTGRTAALAVSGDGQWILTGSMSNDAQLWKRVVSKSAEGRPVFSAQRHAALQGHKAPITAVAFSQNGRLLFTGDDAGRGIVWDASDMSNVTALSDLVGHTARITSAAFLPDGQRILTASGDGTVGQWMVATGEERRDLVLRHARGKSVTSLALTSDGQAVTSCQDGRVRVWDIQRAEVVRQLEAPADASDAAVRCVDVSPDGRWVVGVHPDAQVMRLWDLRNGERSGDGQPGSPPFLDFSSQGLVWAARFSPDGSQVATVGGDNARLWDLSSDAQPRRPSQIFIPHGSVAFARFSPDGKQVVTGSWDNSVRIWSTATGKSQQKLEQHEGAVHSAVYSEDGTRLLTASSDHTARVWDVGSGQVLRVLRGHTGPVRMALFSPDAKRIITVSEDATARIWDAETGNEIRVLRGHRYGVLCAAFASDGRRVMTGGQDNSARVWDVATGETTLVLEGHTADVTSVAFSPDDQRALTGSDDFSAKLWDTEAHDAAVAAIEGPPRRAKEILTLKGHQQGVTSVCFSSDGVLALTGSRDGTAIIWLADRQWQVASELRMSQYE